MTYLTPRHPLFVPDVGSRWRYVPFGGVPDLPLIVTVESTHDEPHGRVVVVRELEGSMVGWTYGIPTISFDPMSRARHAFHPVT